MEENFRIAVIGSGIAGLSCAHSLKRAGHAVRVFDKSRGPAGRMSTRRGDGWQADHGAQYFTAHDPAFRAEVARWQAAGAAALWTPRLGVLGEPRGKAAEKPVERFVGTPKMTSPARLLAADVDLQTGITVSRIERDGNRWRLEAAEVGMLPERFDAVVLAVPAPQAAPLLSGPVPGLARLARGAPMRGCWVLMLRFDAPVNLPFDAAFVNRGPLKWIARDSSKPGRGGQECWILHANAAWSEAHLEFDAADVTRELLKAFAEIGAPAPREISAHRWRFADSVRALDTGCAWSADQRVGLCGDWLNGGRVEGAWLSGRMLAQQVTRAMPACPLQTAPAQ